MTFNPETDLRISRIIKAPRRSVWAAWANPRSFEQWWVPAPARARAVVMDLRPGGALTTEISEAGGPFQPHMNACFLDVVESERIVFTDALTAGWRPSGQPFVSAVMTFKDHAEGTEYDAVAMHKNEADRATHAELGFYDGWGTVIEQLARLVEEKK